MTFQTPECPIHRVALFKRPQPVRLSPSPDPLSSFGDTMASPSDRKFTESHEWIKVEGDTATLGITQFAADELTDLTFVEMKPKGTKVGKGQQVGEVESVKTTSDVYSPIAGEIAEVNQAAVDDPSLINSDPFGKGWLVKLKVSDKAGLDGLMDQSTYDEKHPVG